jgi:hypothetical protein
MADQMLKFSPGPVIQTAFHGWEKQLIEINRQNNILIGMT